MHYRVVKTKTQLKARRSFDYQCKQASNCRKEKLIRSCNSCRLRHTCDIQRAIRRAREKM